MYIKLMNFTKRHNSTARPPENAVTTDYDIVFKIPTSINNPVIKLDTAGVFPAYNYAFIPDLQMYYYIEDVIVGNANIFELYLSLDALSTARPYILSSSSFVKYSTLNYNENLRDDRIVPTTEITTLLSTNTFTDLVSYSNPATNCWCLTTFSKTNGLCSYLISTNTLRYLTQKLTDDGTSIWGSIEQLFGDAKGSILSCQYVPFKLENLQQAHCVADNPSRIYLGDYDTTADGYEISNYCYQIADVIQIPSGVDRDFRIASPYCETKLYAPLIGCIDVALDEYQDANFISFKYVVNIANGNVAFILTKNGGDNVIASAGGNCSLSMPLAFQQLASGFNALVGAASIAAGLVSGGALTIAGIAGGVASFASSLKKTSTSIGSFSGNFSANMDNKMRLSIFKHSISENPSNMASLYGRPCGKVVLLSTLETGYVQTLEFHLLAPLDAAIINAVESLMDSGVYLE